MKLRSAIDANHNAVAGVACQRATVNFPIKRISNAPEAAINEARTNVAIFASGPCLRAFRSYAMFSPTLANFGPHHVESLRCSRVLNAAQPANQVERIAVEFAIFDARIVHMN